MRGNALSQLQPSQVRTMREAFQILDRDSDGAVNREDVADMLNQLGKDQIVPAPRRSRARQTAPADTRAFSSPSLSQASRQMRPTYRSSSRPLGPRR